MKPLTKKVLWVIFIFITMSCNENDTLNQCNQEFTEIDIVEKGSTSKGFFSSECELFNNDDEAFFVIQNESDFTATVNCDQEFPQIDFSKYTLLIGQKKLTWCCATALKQKVTKDCEERRYTYTINIDDPDGKYQALSIFYHWVIIYKISSDYQVDFQLE